MIQTLSPEHVPTTPCASQRDEYLNMVFSTALEGGIGYWSQCTKYRWKVAGSDGTEARDFIAVITEVGDGDLDVEHVIDRGVISRGITRFYEHMRGLSQEGTANSYQWRAAKDLHFGRWDEVDFDSDTADMVVQFGLLGEIRYQ